MDYIRGVILELFLSNEQNIKVKINDTIIKPLTITRGIPQGTMLGPILFLVFVNELLPLKHIDEHLISYDVDTAVIRGELLDYSMQKSRKL